MATPITTETTLPAVAAAGARRSGLRERTQSFLLLLPSFVAVAIFVYVFISVTLYVSLSNWHTLKIDLSLRVFSSGAVPVLIVTTPAGADRLGHQTVPPHVQVAGVEPDGEGPLRAADVLRAIVARVGQADPLILVEGGPHLMADFFGEGRLDELFLTLAPQVAGRDASVYRLGLAEGRLFAPGQPVWGRLKSVKQAGSHLFLRYAFVSGSQPGS